MKSWVSSAFDNPFLGCASTSTGSATKTTAAAKKSTRLKTHKSDEPVFLSASSQQQRANSDLLLSEKYEPKTRAELMVNKSKVDELGAFLDNSFKKQAASIFILNGPPGSGKFVTLKVLCIEKNIDLIVCNLNNLKIDSISTTRDDFANSHDTVNESQLTAFEQFLFKSSRYCNDQIFRSESSSTSKRILFIKEIPNSAYYNQTTFQNILRKFVKYSKCSLCFSFNLTSNVSWDINPFKLFTNELKSELKIAEVSFNSFANSFLSKAVNRILQLEGLQITKDELNDLCSMSNGDLRYAINCLDFYFSKKKKSQKMAKKSNSDTVKKQSQQAGELKIKLNVEEKQPCMKDNIKDVNLNLFRGLGKILHRKHYDSATVEENFRLDKYNELCKIENSLPKHLHSKQRPPLNANPEDVYSKLTLSTDSTLLFLHQNYLEMFTDRPLMALDEAFDSLSDISDALCLSDLLISRNSNIEYSSRSASLNELSATITMRSMLFNLFTAKPKSQQSSQQTGGSKTPGGWKPLYKPYYNKAIETIKSRKQKALELFMNTNQSDNLKLKCCKNEFFQFYLPFICVNSTLSMKFRQRLNNDQKSFINSITAQIHLTNNNKLKTNSFNTSVFSSLRIGQNDIYSANDQEDNNGEQQTATRVNDEEDGTTARAGGGAQLFDYDDGVHITDFKF